jgi:hypothetical protein
MNPDTSTPRSYRHGRREDSSHYSRVGIVLLLIAFAPKALPAPITFSAFDVNVTFGSALPNSNAARTAFVASAPGSVLVSGFESLPLGFSSLINLGGGVTLTQTGFSSIFGGGVSNNNTDPTNGFNTTPGGSQYLRMGVNPTPPGGATALFQFATPITAFGGYFTGIFVTSGTSSDGVTVEFNDGVNEVNLLPTPLCTLCPNSSTASSAQFFGFVTSVPISSVVVRANQPIAFGIDDLQFNAVPEPSTFGFFSFGLLGLALFRRLLCTW